MVIDDVVIQKKVMQQQLEEKAVVLNRNEAAGIVVAYTVGLSLEEQQLYPRVGLFCLRYDLRKDY